VADDGREDGLNSSASRVIRGGSWSFGFITTVDRFGREPDSEESYIGFRCVRDYRGELD
jgi:formylglycine-generating enzyme required for sulfatase activity